MEHESGSETAVAAAMLRAAHLVLDQEPHILEDTVTLGLVPGSSADEISTASERLNWPFMRVLRSSFLARSRIAEDSVARAVADGARQYVLLGAGFDTFAYRQPDWADGLEIFELDHPASQRAKTAALQHRGLRQPTNLHLCPIDFETQALHSVLEAAGFDSRAPSAFSWLGVIPYLTAEAIDATLRQIAESAPVFSLALSYVVPDELIAGADMEAVSISSTASAARGEPWLSRFAPQELEERLREIGCNSIEHFGPAQYEDLFFQGRSDGLPTPSFERIIVASTTHLP